MSATSRLALQLINLKSDLQTKSFMKDVHCAVYSCYHCLYVLKCVTSCGDISLLALLRRCVRSLLALEREIAGMHELLQL
jgi:hypothetical protein